MFSVLQNFENSIVTSSLKILPPSIYCQLIMCLLSITLCNCLLTFFFFFFFSEQKNILQTIKHLIQFCCLSTSTPAHLFPIRGRRKILGTRLIIWCHENKVFLPIIFLKKSEQKGNSPETT